MQTDRVCRKTKYRHTHAHTKLKWSHWTEYSIRHKCAFIVFEYILCKTNGRTIYQPSYHLICWLHVMLLLLLLLSFCFMTISLTVNFCLNFWKNIKRFRCAFIFVCIVSSVLFSSKQLDGILYITWDGWRWLQHTIFYDKPLGRFVCSFWINVAFYMRNARREWRKFSCIKNTVVGLFADCTSFYLLSAAISRVFQKWCVFLFPRLVREEKKEYL